MAFPAVAFQRINVGCLRLPDIVGAAGFGAGPPVFTTGPHGVGAADTNEVNVRKVMVLPPVAAGTTVELAPEGSYTYQGFHNVILNVGLTHADAPVRALWAPVQTWFRAACAVTGALGNPVSVEVTPVPINTPNLNFRMNAFTVGRRSATPAWEDVVGQSWAANPVSTLELILDSNRECVHSEVKVGGVDWDWSDLD